MGSIATKAIPQLMSGNYVGAAIDAANVLKDQYGDKLISEGTNLVKRAGEALGNVVMDEVRKKRHYEV